MNTLKYLVSPVNTTDKLIYFKTNAIKYNITEICNSLFDYYSNNEIDKCISELDSLLEKYTEHHANLTKIWHIFYDYLTCQHTNPIFSIPINIISELTEEIKNNIHAKNVIITMTTCKRMDLTYRTINSLLHCITDLKTHVGKFLIVDDNSDEDDLKQLVKVYPFLTIINKDSSEKGHPKSMNIILKNLTGFKYQFHIEDDWEFFYKKEYITECISILERNPLYGQCLINRDYGEDQITINNIGGSLSKEFLKEDGTLCKYYEHQYFTGNQLKHEMSKCGVSNNLYWPHFSFRVGVTKVSIYDKIKTFNENDKHFDISCFN